MKRITLTLVATLAAIAMSLAQSPAPELDTVRTPVRQGDPEPKTFPSHNYLEGFMRIMPDELPPAVIKTLSSDSTYHGWQKAAVYRNVRNTRFIVERSDLKQVETWQFDAQGR